MARELESKLQRRCQKVITDNGAFVFKSHGNMFTRAGMPDLIACVPTKVEVLQQMIDDNWFKDGEIGVFVGIELKRQGAMNELSRAQEIVGREIQNAGGVWFATDDSEVVEAIVEKMRGKL